MDKDIYLFIYLCTARSHWWMREEGVVSDGVTVRSLLVADALAVS